LFCSLASVGVCHLSSSVTLQCRRAGELAAGRTGGRAADTLPSHGGPVVLRPVRTTPSYDSS